jgi:hypothetical protein
MFLKDIIILQLQNVEFSRLVKGNKFPEYVLENEYPKLDIRSQH